MDLCQNFQQLATAEGFLLLDIPPTLCIKIISKLEAESYFRIQQTCKYLLELAKERKNPVFVEGHYLMSLGDDKDGNVQLYFSKGYRDSPFESPNGIQFEDLELPYETSRRISATARKRTTGQESIELFQILDPKIIQFNCYVEKSHLAIFPLKDLNFIRTITYPESDESLSMVSKFMSITKKLFLIMGTEQLGNDGLYPFIKKVIEILNSEQYPNLQELCFRCSADRRRTEEELLEIFQAYRPSISKKKFMSSILYVKCKLQNPRSSCTIIMERHSITIDYFKIAKEKGKPRKIHHF